MTRRIHPLCCPLLLVWLALAGAAVAADSAPPAADTPARDSLRITPPGSSRASKPASVTPFPAARTVAALAGTVIAIAIGLRAAAKYLPGARHNTAPQLVQILGRYPVATRSEILVVRCGPRVLVLGNTSTQLSTLAEIADPHEIAEFDTADSNRPATPLSRQRPVHETTTPSHELHGQFSGMFERLERWKSEG